MRKLSSNYDFYHRVAKDIRMYQFRCINSACTNLEHCSCIYIYKSKSVKMLRVVRNIRATNINISTDLSFRMRLKLFEKFSFNIKQINQL